MRVAAFIPARGGSTRIPRKNLQTVGSYSLLERAIHPALLACDEVWVSTDDEEIADAARRTVLMDWTPGPKGSSATVRALPRIHDRPKELADAHAQIESAIAHWWSTLEEKPDAVVLLQPTTPFRTERHIAAAVAMLASGYDAVEAVRDISQLYTFRGTLEPVGDDCVPVYVPARPPRTRPRSQDVRGAVFSGNGALWAWTREHWELTGDRMWGRTQGMLLMDEVESMDVDTEDDLAICRAISAAKGI